MKILFVVCGEGLGHASRCLHLGHYMQQQGHEIHFAGYGKSYDFMKQHRCSHIHYTPREVCLEGENGFFSLKKTLWCSKWIVIDMCRSVFMSLVYPEFRFDCVVCDTMYGWSLRPGCKTFPLFHHQQNHFNGPTGRQYCLEALNFSIQRYIRLADLVLTRIICTRYRERIQYCCPERRRRRYSFNGQFYEFIPAGIRTTRNNICQFWRRTLQIPMY